VRTFLAIHRHEYGTSVKVFHSDRDATAIFNALPNPEFGEDEDDEDDEKPGRVDFARKLNSKYEPFLDETFEVQEILLDSIECIDFSEYA
jgi:hypothetical protein